MRTLDDILEEFEFLEKDGRHQLMIELGRELEPMPAALKTDATKVRGCASDVWAYPVPTNDGKLHFLADSNSAFTKGMIAVVLSAVQGRAAAEVVEMDIPALIAPFQFEKQMTSLRTGGLPNMIALVRQHAARLAAQAG
jgi:cysteine desulfuration protein SufE